MPLQRTPLGMQEAKSRLHSGVKHLCAPMGNREFIENHDSEQAYWWVNEMMALCKIANSEPHLAFLCAHARFAEYMDELNLYGEQCRHASPALGRDRQEIVFTCSHRT